MELMLLTFLRDETASGAARNLRLVFSTADLLHVFRKQIAFGTGRSTNLENCRFVEQIQELKGEE